MHRAVIQIRDAKQLERAIERARQSRLVVRRTSVSRMYRVENLDNGQVYTCNFFVRSSDKARFGHCTCRAGQNNKECKHLACAAALNMYDATVRRVAAMVAQMPQAA